MIYGGRATLTRAPARPSMILLTSAGKRTGNCVPFHDVCRAMIFSIYDGIRMGIVDFLALKVRTASFSAAFDIPFFVISLLPTRHPSHLWIAANLQ